MPGGRINSKDKLQPWKPDPTRPMLPPEPNYLNDADSFAKSQRKKAKAKRKRIKEEKVKQKGRGQSSFVINDFGFIITYGTHKNKQLGHVVKRDPEFVRNLVRSGDYQISDAVIKELLKRGVIKSP